MSNDRLRIIFMGTPAFAAAALQDLLRSGHDIIAVYSQPPRPKGRGHLPQKSPVHTLAQAQGIPVFTPHSLKKDAPAQAEFAALGADVAVVAAYGLILPRAVLAAPRFGCLNIHASLLPRWRGAAPIQRAILAGDKESGVTIMQMEEGLDTGPMLRKARIEIGPTMTASDLHDALAKLGGPLVCEVLAELAAGQAVAAESQDEAQACYAPMLRKEEGRIDWTQDAENIARAVRAFNPWPGVYTDFDGRRFKIFAAEIAAQHTGEMPGIVLDRLGHVACGGGSVLRVVSLQPEGKKPMDFAAAVNGGYVRVGAVFL